MGRLNADGTLDSSFNVNAFPNLLAVGPVAFASDNSFYAIVNLGTDPLFDGTYCLAHVFASGQLDPTFQPTVQIDTPVGYYQTPGVFLQNGQPLIWFNTEQDVVYGRFPFFRLNANGALDSSFIGSAASNNASANPLGIVQRDGTGRITNVIVGASQILAAYANAQLLGIGTADAVNYYLRRLNSDGTIDTSFNGPNLTGRLPAFPIRNKATSSTKSQPSMPGRRRSVQRRS